MFKFNNYLSSLVSFLFPTNSLRRLYTYFSMPAIIIHELSHIIMGLLSGMTFSYLHSYIIWNSNGMVNINLHPNQEKTNIFQILMVALSPLYIIITVFILSLFYPIFFIGFAYLIITLYYSFPSKTDLLRVMYMKVFIKYDNGSEVLSRFPRIKGFFEKEESEEILDWAI